MNALQSHRKLAHRLLLALAWAHVLVIGAVGLVVDEPWLALTAAGLVLAGLATGARWLAGDGPAARAAIAMTLMAQISLLVAALHGQAWQVDAHMYYFASLALVGSYCDAFAVLAAAGLVAVHHLLLNFLLPAAIYPGGADFARVVVHAAIVIIESAGLISMGHTIAQAFVRSERALDEAAEARACTESAMREAEELRAAEQRRARDREGEQTQALAEQSRMVDLLGAELARVAQGDLTARIDGDLSGVYARLRADLNAALTRLAATLRDVRGAAQGVRSELGGIDDLARDLSRRAVSQASQLDSIAAAVGEVVNLVGRTAEGAARARAVVSAANGDAESSSAVVRDAMAAMSAITDSATKIGGILGVIDEIAFQTNLLALNAGVEAARAGEAGRGFAVVASEVRALAQRSALAAKEIKTLISTSVAEVDNGATLVRQTGATLDRIVGRVSEINAVVGDIASSASEQSSRITAIDQAVREMETSSRDTASMSERAGAASSALAEESKQLEQLIGQFRVGEAPRALAA